MNKKISFKHITGSMKFIPGIDDMDLAPRVASKYVTNPESGSKPFPILELIPGHVVNIVLVSEEYLPLSDADEALPPSVKSSIENEHAADMLRRRAANQSVRSALEHYARSNDIEIIGESDMDAEEVLNTTYPIVSLSAIALLDWETRGIPVPEALQGNKDTERTRAAQEVAKKKSTSKSE